MKLRYTPRALADLDDIASYLDERSPAAAERVGSALRATADLASTHPHAGRLLRQGVRRLTVGRYPYLVFYEVDEVAEEVSILTFRHAARRPLR